MRLLATKWEEKINSNSMECIGREGQLSGKRDALKSLIKRAYV